MNHVWTVKQDGKELGTVEAVSRKGACHEAYAKFSITPEKRKTLSVEKAERRFLAIDPAIDPASPGSDQSVETGVKDGIICSFNPSLERR